MTNIFIFLNFGDNIDSNKVQKTGVVNINKEIMYNYFKEENGLKVIVDDFYNKDKTLVDENHFPDLKKNDWLLKQMNQYVQTKEYLTSSEILDNVIVDHTDFADLNFVDSSTQRFDRTAMEMYYKKLKVIV